MYHPTNQGFFPLLALRVEQSLSVEEKAAFHSLSTLKDRILYVNGLPRLNGEDATFNVFSDELMKPNFGEKSSESSASKRETGNAHFYSGNYKQAQMLYTLAAFQAPQTGATKGDVPHFALALANRSACLQKLRSYQTAIDDIDLALSSGYPVDKVYKLYERKGECLQQLAKATGKSKAEKEECARKSMAAFELSIKYLQSKSGLPKEKLKKFTQIIQDKIDEAKQLLNEVAADIEVPENEDVDLLPMTPNAKYPSAHEAIAIHYEDGRGRFAVASQDIPLGTLVVKDKPITFALHPERYGTHCQTCMRSIRNAVPCKKCSWVCFCTVACRDEACSSFHQYECGIMKLLLESGLNVYSFLTLRAVCSQGLDNLLQLRNELEGSRSECHGAAGLENSVYRSEDFRNLYNLMAHEEELGNEEWFLRTLVSLFILRALKNSSFFGGKSRKSNEWTLSDDELYVGSVILRLLNICPCNCHDISEYETPTYEKFGPACNKVSVGAGIYPTLALFNHSCDPSFMRCNQGKSVLAVANRLIKKGEEISENYGLMYTVKDWSERNKILREHYHFECQCIACIEKWPSLADMAVELNSDPSDSRMSRFQKIRCTHCGEIIRRKGVPSGSTSTRITCLVCGSETDVGSDVPVTEIKRVSQKSIEALIHGKWIEGINAASECNRLVTKYLSLPLIEVADIQVAIWKCMWLKFGSMKLVKLL